MNYLTKLQELAAWVKLRQASKAYSTYEIRIDDKDPSYLRIELFEPWCVPERTAMASTGTLLTVGPRPIGGGKMLVALQVRIAATAAGDFPEVKARLMGIAELERIAGAFYTRVKGQEYEV